MNTSRSEHTGGRPLITRRTAEIAVRRLLRWVKGQDLTTAIGKEGEELRSFVDTGRLGSARALLEQWRWEQEHLAKSIEDGASGQLTQHQIDLLLAADPRIRQRARDWDESRQ